MGVIVNGVNLSTFGFRLERELVGWKSSPQIKQNVVQVPGREAAVIIGPVTYEPRTLVAGGYQRVWADMPTGTTLSEIWDSLQRQLMGEDLRITLEGSEEREYVGICTRIEYTPIPPVLAQTVHRVQLNFECRDPFAYTVTDTVLSVGASPVSLPLGTAPVRPRLRIGGVSNPVVIYRNGAGTEMSRFTLSGTFATGTPLIINSATSTLTLEGGSPAAQFYVSGSFPRLDPEHAVGGTMPTLLISPSPSLGEVRYRRAWRSL